MEEMSGREMAQWGVYALIMLGFFLVGKFWDSISSAWQRTSHTLREAAKTDHASKSKSAGAAQVR